MVHLAHDEFHLARVALLDVDFGLFGVAAERQNLPQRHVLILLVGGLEGVIVLLHLLHETLVSLRLLDGLTKQLLNLFEVTALRVDLVLLTTHALIQALLITLEGFLGDFLGFQHPLHDAHLFLILVREGLFVVGEHVTQIELLCITTTSNT